MFFFVRCRSKYVHHLLSQYLLLITRNPFICPFYILVIKPPYKGKTYYKVQLFRYIDKYKCINKCINNNVIIILLGYICMIVCMCHVCICVCMSMCLCESMSVSGVCMWTFWCLLFCLFNVFCVHHFDKIIFHLSFISVCFISLI